MWLTFQQNMITFKRKRLFRKFSRKILMFALDSMCNGQRQQVGLVGSVKTCDVEEGKLNELMN